jgi:hypothetical protein
MALIGGKNLPFLVLLVTATLTKLLGDCFLILG